MKKIPIYEKITGLKRNLVMEDFVAVDPPLESSNFPEVTVKFFTENIYIKELACYIVVCWDFQRECPAILILGHTLFGALKRWRTDSMQDIIGKTFTIVAKTNNNVVYHDLYNRGLLPLMTDESIDKMDNYINDLFNIIPIESEE